MTPRAVCRASTIVCFLSVALTAQTRPSRDVTPATPPPAAAGTTVIAGTVVTDDAERRPLRRVSVSLQSGGLQTPQITMTDETGRFRFANVAAGTYSLGAMRPGFVPAFHGAKRPGRGPGVPIAAVAGQPLTNLTIRMLRGSVITGVVRSQSGRPVPGLEILVAPVHTIDGRRRVNLTTAALAAMSGGPAVTDDRGVYRAFGLAPGDYVVQAMIRGFGGSGSNEARAVAASEVQWALMAVTPQTSGVPSSVAPLAPAPPPGQTVAQSPVYYPGTAVLPDATIVSLGPGEERAGVDFATMFVPTARVVGVVLDPEGRPLAGAQVQVRSGDVEGLDAIAMMAGQGVSRSAADGTFTVAGVRPGRYSLTARGTPRVAGREGREAQLDAIIRTRSEAGAAAMIPGLFGGQPLWASEEIAVDGREVSGLTLRLQPGMSVTGRIVYEGATPAPTDLTKTMVTIGPVPTGASAIHLAASMMLGLSPAVTAADGTFVARGVVPGWYRASLTALGGLMAMVAPGMAAGAQNQPGDWKLKSIMWKGRDVADAPFEVKPNEDVAGLVVTMTDRQTELTGSVLDQAGRATPNFPIVVFATDRVYWTVGSRRVQMARPASDGRFKVVGLPPGEYFVCAVLDLDPEDLSDARFLDELRAASALKIVLADGEKKSQDLRLTGG